MSIMDYKWGKVNKLLSWGLGIYLIANLVIVAYIWMQVNKRPDPDQRLQGPPMRFENGLVRDLNFTAEQNSEYLKIETVHKGNIDSLINKILTVKRELAREIIKTSPDTDFVNKQIHIIGLQQETIEKEVFNHMQKLFQICTAEQREKLTKKFKELEQRTHIGGPGSEMGPGRLPKDRMNEKFPPMPPPGN